MRSLQAESKVRRQEKAFVIEGVRLVEEALASRWEIQQILFTEDLGWRGRALVEELTQVCAAVDQVSAAVMAHASETQTPQGILAVVASRDLALPDRLDFAVILDGGRDPGNLGTILRTAAAAGVQAVLLPPGSVDPFSPKVLRAAMGAHFRLPIRASAWPEIVELIGRHGLTALLADAAGGPVYTQVNLSCPLVLIIGGEAAGASAEAQSFATQMVHIPMPGGSESLNASAAAAVILFEAVRQRSDPKASEKSAGR